MSILSAPAAITDKFPLFSKENRGIAYFFAVSRLLPNTKKR